MLMPLVLISNRPGRASWPFKRSGDESRYATGVKPERRLTGSSRRALAEKVTEPQRGFRGSSYEAQGNNSTRFGDGIMGIFPTWRAGCDDGRACTLADTSTGRMAVGGTMCLASKSANENERAGARRMTAQGSRRRCWLGKIVRPPCKLPEERKLLA